MAIGTLGVLGLWLLGLMIGGTLMAGLMSVRHKPLAGGEYAVFGTMALGVGVALAMAPMVPWGTARAARSARRNYLFFDVVSVAAHDRVALFRVINRYVGNVAPMRSVFPNYPAPVTGNTGTKRVASLATLDQARGDDLPLPVFFDDA